MSGRTFFCAVLQMNRTWTALHAEILEEETKYNALITSPFSTQTALQIQDTESNLIKLYDTVKALVDAKENAQEFAVGSQSKCTETENDPQYDYTKRVQYKKGVWQCPPGWTDTKCSRNDPVDVSMLQCKKPVGQDAVTECTEVGGPDPDYEYTKKTQDNGIWSCPPDSGWVDTKCSHRDGMDIGMLQCKRKKGSYDSKCTETSRRPGYEYTKRVQYKPGIWQCPPGWDNTMCSKKDGADLQDLQCRKPAGQSPVPQCTEKVRDPRFVYTKKSKTTKGWTCPDGYMDTKCSHRDGAVSSQLQCKKLSPAEEARLLEEARQKAEAIAQAAQAVREKQQAAQQQVAQQQVAQQQVAQQQQSRGQAVPVSPSSFSRVWQPQGTYGHWKIHESYLSVVHKARQNRGGSFDTNPYGMFPATHMAVTYDVIMPQNWEPNKGGKLPGFCLGPKRGSCANGREWGSKTGSVRIMWQRGGHAILYVYLATGSSKRGYDMQQQQYTSVTRAKSTTGHSVWHGNSDFTFKPGVNTVSIEVKLNTVGQADGMLGLRVNGVTKVIQNVVFREHADVMISSFRMTSFYGGSSSDWGPKTDQVMQFRNFSFIRAV